MCHKQVGTKSSPVARKLSEVMLPPPEANENAALVALLTALPFGLAAGWMLLLAKSSQRTGTPHTPFTGFHICPLLVFLVVRQDGIGSCRGGRLSCQPCALIAPRNMPVNAGLSPCVKRETGTLVWLCAQGSVGCTLPFPSSWERPH